MTTKRVNKYIYMWVVQGYYAKGYGWEDVYTGENYTDARLRLKEYRENERDYAHRMIQRRELNPEYIEKKR